MTTSLEHAVPQALWLVDGAAGLGTSIILRKGNEAKRASCEEAIVICYCGVHAETYFGEWAEDMREQSIGLLDRIKSPRMFLTDHPKALREYAALTPWTLPWRGRVTLQTSWAGCYVEEVVHVMEHSVKLGTIPTTASAMCRHH